MDQPRKHQKDAYRVWLKQADFDLQAANLSYQNDYYEWACFQSQQSLEKALKAILVHGGWRAPKIHKLGILMSMSNKVNNAFVNIQIEYRKLDAYTFVSRYPFLLPGEKKSPHEYIQKKDAGICLQVASDALSKIKELLIGSTSDAPLKELKVEHFTAAEVEDRIVIVTQKLKESLDLQKIVLFGSFARNKERTKDKTMDLLIIANIDLPFFDRIRYVRELLQDGEPIVEPLIYTPQEFDELLNQEGESFFETAIEEGEVIYKK